MEQYQTKDLDETVEFCKQLVLTLWTWTDWQTLPVLSEVVEGGVREEKSFYMRIVLNSYLTLNTYIKFPALKLLNKFLIKKESQTWNHLNRIYMKEDRRKWRNTRIIQVVPAGRWFRALVKLIIGKVYHTASNILTWLIAHQVFSI